jgi:predicted GNAT family acetyltransferase
MEILKPHSLTEFVDVATPFLCRAEAAHGLLLGTAIANATSRPDAYSAIVMSRGAVVAAGLRTTTRLIVSHESEAGAMTLLSSDATGPELQGVIGPPRSVETFTHASGGEWRRTMAQGVYECRRVIHEKTAPGAMRVALPADHSLITDWVQRLADEALDEQRDRAVVAMAVDAHIARGTMRVWEIDGRIMSLAAAVSPTPHGIRLNHVYTPPELRGRGYAGSLVAALTQSLLDGGRHFVFLHTDLSNPTSNALYVRLGYQHVSNVDVLQRLS